MTANAGLVNRSLGRAAALAAAVLVVGVVQVPAADAATLRAVDDSARVAQDAPATEVPVLTNDTGTGLKRVIEVTDPAHGTVVLSGALLVGQVTYQPDPGYCNTAPGDVPDVFTYKLLGGSSATVSMTVTCAGGTPPVIAAVETSALSYAENAAASPITATGTVTDTDSPDLATGTLTVDYSVSGLAEDRLAIRNQGTGPGQIGVSGSDVTYAGTVIGTFTGGSGTTALVVTLNAGATPTAVQALLRSITYHNVSDTPSVEIRTVRFVLTDGDTGVSAPVTRRIIVTAVDDAPVAGDDTATVLEDSTAAAVPVLANDTDVDGGQKTIASASDPAHGTVVRTGGGTGLTYRPDAGYCNNPPGTTPDTFAYTLNGGSSATVSITVTCNNVAPVLAAIEGDALAYTEQDTAVTITSTLTVTDADADDIESAVVDISAGFHNGDELVFTNQNGITGSYNSATGVLTLTGSSSVANYQTALRSIQFRNLTNDDPGTSRTIRFQVNDGTVDSTTVTRAVTINETNDAPLLAAIEGGAAAYTEQGTPVAVTDTITVADADASTIASAEVDISVGRESGDELVFTNQNGITGTYNASTGVLTLTGSSSPANYQTALRSIEFRNLTNNDPAASRTIRFTVNDGTADSNTLTRTITVTAVDDAPVAVNDSATVNQDALAAAVPVLTSDTDVDAGPKTITSASDPTHGTVVLTGGSPGAHTGLTYQPDAGYCNSTGGGADTFTYTLNGGGTATVSMTVTCNVAPVAVNDSATTAEDTFVDIDVSANDTDAETANAGLTATSIASETGGNAVLRPGGRIIRFTPDADHTGTGSFTYRAYDGTTSSLNTATVTVTVTGTNDPPQISDASPEPTYPEQNNNSVNVSGNAVVSDVDDTNLTSATITITSPLPGDKLAFVNIGGMTGNFVGGVLTFTGTASVADYQTAIRLVAFSNTTNNNPGTSRTITLKVNDGSLSSNTLTRTITITPVDDAPVVTLDGTNASYTENAVPVAVGAGGVTLTVTDADSSNLAFAEVQIGAGYVEGEDSLIAPTSLPPGITADFDADTGRLRFDGPASPAAYQQLLRSVDYQTSANTFTSLERPITFRVNDGTTSSIDVTRTVNITPVNDFPTVADVETTPLAYTEQGSAVTVSSTITIADVDSPQLTQAYVTIQTGYRLGDELAFTPQFGITGSFNPGSRVLALTGSATPAQYQAVLRSVTFHSTSDDPGTSRSVRFGVSDAALNSNELARTVTITEVNDGPVVTVTAGTVSANQQVPTVIDDDILVSDPDSLISRATVSVAVGFQPEDVLTLPGQPLPGGITASQTGQVLTLTGTTTVANYQAALRTVTYTNTSTSPNLAVRTVRFQVTDDGSPVINSVVKDRLIQPVDTPENVAPTDTGESYTTTGNTSLWVDRVNAGDPEPQRTSSISLLDNANDPDGPESALTTVNVTQGAHGQVDLDTDGSFVYTPVAGYTGTDSFTYRVSDRTSVSAPSTVNLTVERRVWYVDNSGPSGGDGRSATPFQTLEAADLAATSPNDIIYVRYGSGTPTGYDTDVDLLVGQQLLGEGVDLNVGGVLLFTGAVNKSPLLNSTINMASGDKVAGVTFTGTRATPAIAGNVGDNGGTVMDTKILGARSGVELIGTTGDWTFWDVTINVTAPTAYAFRAENAGVLNFTANGTNAFGGTVAGAVKILTTVTTGSIDTVTAMPGSTAGIEMQLTGGDLTFGSVNLTTSDTALQLNNADAITVGGGSVTSTGGNFGIRLANSANSSITIPSGSLSGQAATVIFVGGGSGTLTYGGSIGNVTGGFAVSIADHDNGEIRLTGPITSNGAVSVQGGAAPVAITNPNNVISSGGVTAVSVTDQFVSPDGMTFKSLSNTTSGYGLYLQNTTGGQVTVTGSGTAGSGGTLKSVHLQNTANPVELHWVSIVTGGNFGVEATDARRLVLRDSKITGGGTGIDLEASTGGVHEYVIANNTIALTRANNNRGIELSNPIFTAPVTKIWLIGNVISGTELDGVSLNGAGTATVTGQLTDNMISDYCQYGVRLLNALGTATADYTATGNVLTDTCDDPNDGLRTGLAVSSGNGSSPGTTGDDGGEMCLDARGNALSHSGTGFPGDYLLQVVNEAKFFMPGLGSTDPGVRFVNQNSADGAPSGSVQDTADPPVGGFFTGTCETPGVPPA